MGYNSSNGPIVLASESFTPSSDFTKPEAFIQWLRQNLTNSGWEREQILAHVKFTVSGAIVPGVEITIAGHLFTFTDGVDAPFAVPVGSTNKAGIVNLATHTANDIGWTVFTITGSDSLPSIEWQVPLDGNDGDYTGNILNMSVSPVGSVGLWDFNPEGLAGQGRSWGGGFHFVSAEGPGGGILALKAITNNNFPILIQSEDEIATFSGLLIFNTWNILANRFQFFLFITGSTGAGTFFMAANLFPYGSLGTAIFMAGPINFFLPNGANRSSLAGIGVRYYVNAGSPYFGFSTAALEQVPNFCLPGWGAGITPIQKLSNRIGGLDIKRDNGAGIPSEAFIAARLSTVGPGSDKIYILGSLYDAYISLVHGTLDAIETINGKNAIVMITQSGSTQNSRGSLIVQTED